MRTQLTRDRDSGGRGEAERVSLSKLRKSDRDSDPQGQQERGPLTKVLSARWIGFHLLTIGCVVLFCILGHWQWDVGDSHRGTLRNFAYGAEWWIFAAILLVLWYRLIRQELRGERRGGANAPAESAPQPKPPRHRVPAPEVAIRIDEEADPELAAYNRYLRALHEKDVMKDAARRVAKES